MKQFLKSFEEKLIQVVPDDSNKQVKVVMIIFGLVMVALVIGLKVIGY